MFNAAANAQSTLLYGSFAPAATLEQTVRLASSNPRFARARDALWAGAAHQRVTDDADALVAGNPVLRNDGVRDLLARRDADGERDDRRRRRRGADPPGHAGDQRPERGRDDGASAGRARLPRG